MSRYSYIVDGEVAAVFTIPDKIDDSSDLPPSLQKLHAVLKSQPIVMELLEEYGIVEEGYIWDGQNFNPPAQ
jgi:hypothetical protein